MPKERLQKDDDQERIGPKEVYVTLRDLVALQFEAFGFSFLPKYAVASILSGRNRSKLRGRGLDFEEVRKYVAGDDIRNIDWRVTARVGVTHSKVFTEEKERPVFIITDQSSSMFFGSTLYFKSVTAAHLAAIGCWRVLDQGDRVGGIVFNDKKIDYVSPKRDRRAIQRYLSYVAEQNQDLKAEPVVAKFENPLYQAVLQANQVITHDYLVLVISDFNKADIPTLKQLVHLKKNNDVILARITDPAETSIPTGKIILSDGQHQTRLDKGKRFRKEFTLDREAELLKVQEGFKKYGMPLLEFNTQDQPSKLLRSMLSNNHKLAKQ